MSIIEGIGVEDGPGEEAADQRSGDRDDRGDDEAARVVARKQCLCDRPREKSEDDERDDAH